MIRCVHWCALALVLLLLSPVIDADDQPGNVAALRAALEARHPAVESWNIQPLSRLSDAPETSGAAPRVLRVGSRSAVQVDRAIRWYSVSGHQHVWVARAPLAAGSALGANRVDWLERDALGVNCRPLAVAASWDGYEAARDLRAGEILCGSDLRPIPTVKHGDTVVVEVRGDRVAIRGRALALEDGRAGDTIAALNAQTREHYAARVTESGSLYVDMRTTR